MIKVQQTRSPIRSPHDQRETLIGLGLNRIGRVKEVPDTPSTHGLIAKVKHLVRATRFFFGDGTTKLVFRATDLIPYLHPKRRHQFRRGYSMAELAICWLAAAERKSPVKSMPIGTLPCKIEKLVGTDVLETAYFEYPVQVWGDGISMTDIMAFMPSAIITVEGKARETFDTEVRNWAGDMPNRLDVVDRYAASFNLRRDDLMGLRYQLLHRTLSAALVARKYGRKSAWMIVHSFAPLDCKEHARNRADFDRYVALVGPSPELLGVPVHVAWVDSMPSVSSSGK